MARQQTLLGPLSGRIGDKIYCVRNGISYVRSLPKKTDKVPTEKQLIHRAKFSLVMSFLSQIISILNDSYRRLNPKKTGTRMVVNQIFEEALSGEYPNVEIDYSKVKLIRGGLNCFHGQMAYVAGSNELDFTWILKYGVYHDVLLPLIYCSTLNEFWYDLNVSIRRGDEFGSIQIPQRFIGYEIHIWLGYRSEDGRAFSDSRYIGQVSTQKTSGYENL